MRKKLLMYALCSSLIIGNVSLSYAEDLDARISEIETQIEQLQTELADLKQQKMEQSGDIYINKAEYTSLFDNPDSYKEKDIKIAGRMFNAMEQDANGKYFQMMYNLNGEDKTVVVMCDLDAPDFMDGDYVLLSGKVLGQIIGQNAFGGDVRALAIKADMVAETDYATAINPAIKTVDVGLQIDQYGYIIIVDKVEFAENETRLYAKVQNNGIAEFGFASYSTKIVQGSSQYEYEYNYEADYPEIQTEILPGVTSSGIICFPPMNPDESFAIYFDGYSENWDEGIRTYQFNVNQ